MPDINLIDTKTTKVNKHKQQCLFNTKQKLNYHNN